MLNPATRIFDLTRLGFSTSILELSAGRKPHPLFQNICNDPYYIYRGGSSPSGLLIVPIWEDGMEVTAALETQGKLQVIRFNLELPNAYSVIAGSEQGLWADLFASLLDGWSRSEADPDAVAEDAVAPANPARPRVRRVHQTRVCRPPPWWRADPAENTGRPYRRFR